MRIEAALSQVGALHDLPGLVDALGGEPRFGELGPSAWLGPMAARLEVSAAAEVGRIGGIPVFGVTTSDAERTARSVARRCAAQGHPALIIAIGRLDAPLAFGCGVDPIVTLTVDPASPDAVAVASLRRIRGLLGGGPTTVALHLAEALAGQRVDRAFFATFREIRDRMAAEGPSGATSEERRALALLQLTRVLFLYFIQRKGWLDGREDFIARAVDDHFARRRPIATTLLRPLFHGTLNRESGTRSAAVRRFGRIPFLNGGLFEPHLLERRWSFDHSDESWRAAFDGLFERFHFTLDERGDGRAIAPDMLGRVFEGLMAEDERRATGTFYTPTKLVDRIVLAGAGALVAERLGLEREEGAALVAERAPSAGLVLSRCRVLDPAVGSGAFLLGALHLFSALEEARDPTPGHRRRVLRSQLFGVDLSAEAVRIAELRLWLAAVAKDPDGPDADVEPLPNLDAALRQGDSLQDPRWLAEARRVPRAMAERLAAARSRFAAESGPRKREAWRELRTAETGAAEEALVGAEGEIERRLHATLDDGRNTDLFGARRGIDRELRERLRRLRDDRRRVRGALRRLRREGSLPWFDAPSAFGEVFAARGGFDLVLGNPPWVRAEELPQALRAMLGERYRWWRSGTSSGFGHSPDLAVAFLERSAELAAPCGVVAMLVPAKVATAGYATTLRTVLAGDLTIDHVDDLTMSAADSFAAVTYPLALVFRKRRAGPDHRIAVALEGKATVAQRTWTGAPWVLRAPEATALISALRADNPTINTRYGIHLGIKCGCNAAFLHPPAGIDAELVRRAVRGRGIAPFRVAATEPLLFPHDATGRPLSRLPEAVARHLAPWKGALLARADATRGPWWALHRTAAACGRHRVVWADLARRLEAVALPRETLPLNSCYLALTPRPEEAGALTAWLNSNPIRALARASADPARGGFARFNARVVGELPLPADAAGEPRLQRIAAAAAAGEEVQDELDQVVAQLLGIGARERKLLRPLA